MLSDMASESRLKSAAKSDMEELRGVPELAVLDALKSIEQFICSWEAANRYPDDYIFYRLVCGPSGHRDLRLSHLRKASHALRAIGGHTASPEMEPSARRKPSLTDAERERRRRRMKEYWRQKRGAHA